MLVLSRKVGQTILVGENISIHVLQVSGGSVRLGIEAPRDIRILRGELELPANDEPFSSMPHREQESIEGSLSTGDPGGKTDCPEPGTHITHPHSMDAQQLLRQTDLLQ
ncbi:MAG: carbon storage regulator [Pirellulaceae bacterium]